MQHLSRAYDTARSSPYHSLSLRSQHLQGLSLLIPSKGTNKEESKAKTGEMFIVSAKDRILCSQSKFNGFDLHLQQ